MQLHTRAQFKGSRKANIFEFQIARAADGRIATDCPFEFAEPAIIAWAAANQRHSYIIAEMDESEMARIEKNRYEMQFKNVPAAAREAEISIHNRTVKFQDPKKVQEMIDHYQMLVNMRHGIGPITCMPVVIR